MINQMEIRLNFPGKLVTVKLCEFIYACKKNFCMLFEDFCLVRIERKAMIFFSVFFF